MEHWKRSGQIPEFGNWDYANELPITQYFENARQAGLIGYSDSYVYGEQDLYAAVDFKKKTTRIKDRKYMNGMVNETAMRKHGKVYDVKEYPRKAMNKKKVNDVVCSGHQLPSTRHPKPVDEDLYKIPPQLLVKTKRKKMLGFISKCLVPAACVS